MCSIDTAGPIKNDMNARALHYVLKIGDRKKSYDFFTQVLKMKVLRHEEFEEGCKATCNGPYKGKWSKTMMGYGSEDNHFVLELTYNYEIGSYMLGNDYFGIFVECDAAFDHVKASGDYIERPCGKLMVRDPDGHHFMVDRGEGKVVRASTHVQHLQRSIDYWHGVLGMSIVNRNDEKKTCSMSYGNGQCRWEVRELTAGYIDRGTAHGRIAFSYPTEKLSALQSKIKDAKLPILTKLTTLQTPGKADVSVVILADPDAHEICFVGDEGFRELSRVDPSSDDVIRKEMEKDDSDNWFQHKKRAG